jgi:hypothetical protein
MRLGEFLTALLGQRHQHAQVKAVITDVTRMQGDRVCIAALSAGRTVRLHEPHPHEGWLASIGGLEPGDVVRVYCRPANQVSLPHTEDYEWNPASVLKIAHLGRAQLAGHLEGAAFATVREAFGEPAIRSKGGTDAFACGRGKRSLATLAVSQLRVYRFQSGIRADFTDRERSWTMVPVEDLALRTGRMQMPSPVPGGDALLRIGVGRPFAHDGVPAACYLQVNHIIIPSDSQRRLPGVTQGAEP